MPTASQLISDIELRLSKGVITDDFQVDRRQILFWLNQSREELMKAYIDSEGSSELESFLSKVECVPISSEDDECIKCGSKFYIELPTSVSSLPNDIGVYRVETQAGTTIKKISPSEVSRIKHSRFGKPSPTKMYYYRVKNTLHIEGGGKIFLNGGKVTLYVISYDVSIENENDEYPISSFLVARLLDLVEERGRRQLGMPEDLVEDGKQ